MLKWDNDFCCPTTDAVLKRAHTLPSGSAGFSFFSCTGNLPPFFFLMAHSPLRLYVLLLPSLPIPRASSGPALLDLAAFFSGAISPSMMTIRPSLCSSCKHLP